MRNIYLIIFLAGTFFNVLKGQVIAALPVYDGKVGVNTNDPKATMDINGDIHVKKVYLRNPSTDILTAEGGKYLATFEDTSDIGSVDLGKNYLFNSITLKLNNVSSEGIRNLNTGISSDNFVVVLHSYSITRMGETGNSRYNVSLYYKDTDNNNNKQGSPYFRTYINNTNEWMVDAYFTDSLIKNAGGSGKPDKNQKFEIVLNLMAYKNLITKSNIDAIDYDANNGFNSANKCTYAFSAPPGFATNVITIDGVEYNLSEGTCITK